MNEAYNTFKAAHHIERIEDLRSGAHTRPVHLQVSISDLCNQDCNFCSYRASDGLSTEMFSEEGNFNPNRMIPTKKMIEVLDDCVGMDVRAVEYQGGGEPTTHPDCAKILKATVDRNLDLALVTNGLKMTAEVQEILMRASWVRISLDAGTIETYAKIRRTPMAAFNTVHRHVDELVKLKQRTGSKVAISLGFVITEDNWEEIVSAAHIAHELGVDMIRYTPAVLLMPSFLPWDRIGELLDEAKTYEDEGLKVYDSRRERKDGRPRYQQCGIQYLTTYLGGDQNLYRCCLTTYTERGLIGSIKDKSFEELWTSEATRRTMATFDARGCLHCKFNQQNELINYLTQREPRFVNFV